MAYSKTTWQNGDVITAPKLNKMEQGIFANYNAIESLEQGSLSAVGASVGDIPIADGNGNWDWLSNGFVTPEMYDAVGDGVTDDTTALQNMLNSGEICVIPAATYAISSPLTITTDTTVICDVKTKFVPIANMTYMLICGETVTPSGSSLLNGLIRVVWEGGFFDCVNGAYTAQSGINLQKLHDSHFSNIAINDVTTYGIHWSGSYGAGAFAENVDVKGISSVTATGFCIDRNDQRLMNCTAVDCVCGFDIKKGGITIDKCSSWVTVNTNWSNTVFAKISGNNVRFSNCTVDTVYTGFLMSPTALHTVLTNIDAICNTGVVSDYTGSALFRASNTIPNTVALILIGFITTLDRSKFSLCDSSINERYIKLVDKGYRVPIAEAVSDLDSYKESGSYCIYLSDPNISSNYKMAGWSMLDVSRVASNSIIQTIRTITSTNRTKGLIRIYDGSTWSTADMDSIDVYSLSEGNITSLDSVLTRGIWFRYCTSAVGVTSGFYLIMVFPISTTIIGQVLIGVDNSNLATRLTADGGSTWNAWNIR